MKNNPTTLIDQKVTLTMIACIVVGIIILAFRYKSYEPCIPVKISVKEGKINTGELVRFTAETKEMFIRELVWDFGDKSTKKGNGNFVTHIYTAPAKYDITLSINGKCREYKTIYVTKAPPPSINLRSPTFTCPLTAKVGEVIHFKDTTPNAITWEWRFGETNNVDATTPEVEYAFKTAGLKEVFLVVNGNMQGYRTVDVEIKPLKAEVKPKKFSMLPHAARSMSLTEQSKRKSEKERAVTKDTLEIIKPKAVAVTKAPEISKSKMEDMLRKVVDGSKDASAFLEYLCGDLNLKVMYNGRRISFSQMCGELKGEMKKAKKIKALEVIFQKDPNTNCIKYMTIEAKKKWL